MVAVIISDGILTMREENETIDQHIERHQQAVKDLIN